MRPKLLALLFCGVAALVRAEADLRIGLIGLDTSHAPQFASILNNPADKAHLTGARVVCAFPGGSADVEASASRVKGFTADVKNKFGVEIVDSIAEVVARSDAIMILSVDGRAHLPQAREVFASGKPVFIDKPFAGNLREVLELAELARRTGAPVFSASSLRYSPGVQKLRTEKIGRMLGAVSYGPAHLEPHHPDLYWYGIHATEALYTVMGMGCETVSRTHTTDTDVATGVWKDGRTGVVYGFREGKALYRVTVFGTEAVRDQQDGREYADLLKEILTFFRTKKAPVSLDETVEIMAFMEAADESKRAGGAPVALKDVIAKNSPSHP
jgi:predicted dehydrogenase